MADLLTRLYDALNDEFLGAVIAEERVARLERRIAELEAQMEMAA